MASLDDSGRLNKIEDLFQQLFTIIDQNLNRKFSLSAIFVHLHNLCDSLITADRFAWIVFEIILKNYMKLFDIDQFVDAIIQDDAKDNNRFLRAYSSLTTMKIHQQSMKNSREIFFFLFDQLNSSKRLLAYLENTLSNQNEILIHICHFLLYTILKMINDLELILTHNDLAKYPIHLFHALIGFLDRNFLGKKTSREENIFIEQLRLFLWARSRITPAISILININCPQACLHWLTLPYLNTEEYEFILHMLYNIARHDEGVRLLKKFDCAKIVREFQTKELNLRMDFIINQEWYGNINRVLDMILVSIIDSEEANNELIKRILSLTKLVLEHPQYNCMEYHVSELLLILMQLCTNENIMDYILQQDQYPECLFMILNRFLLDMEKDFDGFMKNGGYFNDLAITALANIFWSMSFENRYRKYLIPHLHLIKRLGEFRETYAINNEALFIHIPSQMSSLRRTLDGIAQNLYPRKLDMPSIDPKKTACSLMISYSQVNLNFCREFVEMLNKLPEFVIQVDFKTGKYSWKETADMIEQSDVILFLLSKEFYQNKSCRQEFLYVTDTLKKLFFPIFIDSEFKPSGWLHKRVARLKAIRFGGGRDFLDSCEELLILINENLSMNISLINDSFDVKKWNEKEIQQWFSDHQIRSELYEFYHFQNGQELLLYANATLAFSWVKEYERIKERFEEKFRDEETSLSSDQFLQFIYALKRLLK